MWNAVVSGVIGDRHEVHEWVNFFGEGGTECDVDAGFEVFNF